jgi:hypothetical protein
LNRLVTPPCLSVKLDEESNSMTTPACANSNRVALVGLGANSGCPVACRYSLPSLTKALMASGIWSDLYVQV